MKWWRLGLVVWMACAGNVAIGYAAPAQRMRVALDVKPVEEPEFLCLVAPEIEDTSALRGQKKRDVLEVLQVEPCAEACEPSLRERNECEESRDARDSNEGQTSQECRSTGSESGDPEEHRASLPVEVDESPRSPICSLLFDTERSHRWTTNLKELRREGCGGAGKSTPLRVQCVRNGSPRFESEGRALLLQLTPGSECNVPTVTSISLLGNLVTIQLRDAYVGSVLKALAIRSLESDYEAGEPRFLNDEHQISLPIQPLYRAYRVQYPRGASPGGGVHACIASPDEPATCREASRSGEFKLEVRDVEEGNVVLLPAGTEMACSDVASCRPKPDDSSSASVRGSGRGWPGACYLLREDGTRYAHADVARFSFGWRRHCLYSAPQCPKVTLRGVRGDCVAESTESPIGRGAIPSTCRYTCTPEGKIELPAQLEFETTSASSNAAETVEAQRWVTELEYLGQELDGYLALEQRRLIVVAADLCGDDSDLRCLDSVDQRLDYTEVRFPGGDAVRVKAHEPPREAAGYTIDIAAPGLNCTDVLLYQHYGDLPWDERAREVKEGRLELPPYEEDLGSLVGFAVQLGGGLSWAAAHELSAHTGAQPLGKLEGILSWGGLRRHRIPWDLELRLGGVFTSQWYETSRTTGEVSVASGIETQRGRLPHSKVLLQGGATGKIPGLPSFFDKGYLGASVGVSNGRPLFVDDEAVVPMSANFTSAVRAGYFITKRLRIEADGMLVYGEPTRSFEFTPLGDPSFVPSTITPFLVSVSFRLDMR